MSVLPPGLSIVVGAVVPDFRPPTPTPAEQRRRRIEALELAHTTGRRAVVREAERRWPLSTPPEALAAEEAIRRAREAMDITRLEALRVLVAKGDQEIPTRQPMPRRA